MTATENQIRDALADNLEVLEPGLKLISKEHPVPNAIGSKGFIDILAKDRFGIRVIIELKRSDQAARQAIHELFKYVALFREENGLAENKIRCLIVSTEWRELRVAYAELCRSCRFQVDGFLLTVDSDGEIRSATKQEPAQLKDRIRLFRDHCVFLFRDRDRRDDFADKLTDAFIYVGGESGFLVHYDYAGALPSVIYPFAVYLVPAAIRPDVWHHLVGAHIDEYGASSHEEDEEQLTIIQSSFGLMLMESLGNCWDTFEIGYPEKFLATLSAGWQAVSIRRLGTAPTAAAMEDDEVIALIGGTEGENQIQFHKITSPRLHLDWGETSRAMLTSLKGNEAWTVAARHFLLRLNSLPGSSVSIAIYNPLSIPLSLYKLLMHGDPRFLPSLEIVAFDEATEKTLFMLGRVEWNGASIIGTVGDVFSTVGGVSGYLLRAATHISWQLDKRLMRRHNLRYGVVEGEIRGGKETHTAYEYRKRDKKLLRRIVPVGTPLQQFVQTNQSYLASLCEEIQKHSTVF